MCSTGKQAYITVQDAHKALRHMTSHNRHSQSAMRKFGKGKAVAFKCGMCGAWHIGHDNQRRSLRRHA